MPDVAGQFLDQISSQIEALCSSVPSVLGMLLVGMIASKRGLVRVKPRQ